MAVASTNTWQLVDEHGVEIQTMTFLPHVQWKPSEWIPGTVWTVVEADNAGRRLVVRAK